MRARPARVYLVTYRSSRGDRCSCQVVAGSKREARAIAFIRHPGSTLLEVARELGTPGR